MCAQRAVGGQASGVRALSSHAIESHQCTHCGWHMELLAPSHLYALFDKLSTPSRTKSFSTVSVATWNAPESLAQRTQLNRKL